MSELSTFHIHYPHSNNFLTWDELGCLSRSLGFPSDLFRRYLPQDVRTTYCDNTGMSVKTFHRVLEQASLHTVLHRTYNMHTAQWNVRVIQRTLVMLEHKVLNFDDVYKVRVAYMTYEHGDMKGMLLHKNVLIRTLKFCGRVISPLKLLHRVKHMKDKLDERGRIQLYEFYNLILWCDLYTSFDPQQVETSSGKDGGHLFKVVDFRRLLSHHDQRLAHQLNHKFYKEERDYGKFSLGRNQKFTEQVVITQARIDQANLHNDKYRYLKQEIEESEKRVNQAQAGSIRDRPLSAPDLTRFEEHKQVESTSSTMKRRLQSAPPRVKRKSEKGSTCTDTTVPLTPRAVSADDVREMTTKMAELQFEIVTSDCRSQLNLEAEIDFYLPGYLQRRPTQDHVKFSEQVAVKKPEHWTLEILERLTNPKGFKRNSHDRCCDAGQLPGRDLQQRNSSEINFAKFKGADKTQRVSLNIGPSKNTQQDIPREDCRETKTILTKSCKDQPETLDGPHVLPEDRIVEANKETLESMSQDILNQKSCAVEEIIPCQKRVSWATNDIVIAFTDQSYLSHPHIEPVVTVKDKEGLLQILSPAYTETGETRQKEATRSSTTAAPRVRERAQQRDSLNGPSRPCGGDKGNAPACESNTSTVVNDKLDLLTAALDQAHPRCETFNRKVSNISNNKNKMVGKERALQSNAFISLRSSDTNGRQQARSVSLARDKATEKNRRLARSRLLARIRCARSEDYLNCIN
ncbi:uncharacterized protein LOC106061077 isoform X2 [Biomphalaria glabrata]|uniref:Uncharacterized protein LOC106061077 isoform X2 n=1 Tax=Biomphalaria glabrata TaxID=6526 RepID=A0A9W3BJ91_BIOGL|nr:uncharacterized protein LOC106061077 isoform X2 [Biomphalaria glabrata]